MYLVEILYNENQDCLTKLNFSVAQRGSRSLKLPAGKTIIKTPSFCSNEALLSPSLQQASRKLALSCTRFDFSAKIKLVFPGHTKNPSQLGIADTMLVTRCSWHCHPPSFGTQTSRLRDELSKTPENQVVLSQGSTSILLWDTV